MPWCIYGNISRIKIDGSVKSPISVPPGGTTSCASEFICLDLEHFTKPSIVINPSIKHFKVGSSTPKKEIDINEEIYHYIKTNVGCKLKQIIRITFFNLLKKGVTIVKKAIKNKAKPGWGVKLKKKAINTWDKILKMEGTKF